MALLNWLKESELKCDPTRGGAGRRARAGGAGGRAGQGEEAGPIKCSLSQGDAAGRVGSKLGADHCWGLPITEPPREGAPE